MEEVQQANQVSRQAFESWQREIQQNIYTMDSDLMHTIRFHFPDNTHLNNELQTFGDIVPTTLEQLVNENNLAVNLPRLETYNAIGQRIDKVVHHPTYVQAGDIIYGTKLLARMSKRGGLLECLSFLFLSAQVGEAGHNC